MLVPSTAALLALSNIIFSTTTHAAPTRTRCRCTLLDSDQNLSSSPSSSYSPLTPPQKQQPQHQEPLPYDICTSLGPELENFRHTEPTLYESYMNEASIAHSTTQQQQQQQQNQDSDAQPPTTVLLGITNRNNVFRNLGVLLPPSGEPRPTERPTPRIICAAEPEPFSAYQDSFVTLAVLQLIIALTILACVAEGVNMGLQWMHKRFTNNNTEVQKKPVLRLLGGERRLRAFSTEQVHSPGVEKKLRAYEAPGWVNRSPSQKHEFNAFEEDEDDEMNMPVM